jgi:uncharacterized membrane-anchored protein
MAVATLLVVLFLSDALAHLPHAVLGAIVFVVAAKLIDVREVVRIFRARRSELATAAFAAVMVIVFDVAVVLVRQVPPVTVISQVTWSPLARPVVAYVFDAPLCTLPPFTLKS